VDSHLYHVLACRAGGGVIYTHDAVNRVVANVAREVYGSGRVDDTHSRIGASFGAVAPNPDGTDAQPTLTPDGLIRCEPHLYWDTVLPCATTTSAIAARSAILYFSWCFSRYFQAMALEREVDLLARQSHERERTMSDLGAACDRIQNLTRRKVRKYQSMDTETFELAISLVHISERSFIHAMSFDFFLPFGDFSLLSDDKMQLFSHISDCS
jgi:hypothetical protein